MASRRAYRRCQLEFAFVEVLSELGPFFLGRFTVFGFGANASPVVKIRPVRTDHLVREHREVVLRSLKTSVAKHFGSDVDGQPSGHRFSGEHSAKVVWPELHWLTRGICDSCTAHCQFEQPVDRIIVDHNVTALSGAKALEEVWQWRSFHSLIGVVATDGRDAAAVALP